MNKKKIETSISNFLQARDWIDRHIDPIHNCVSRYFMEGVDVFVAFSSAKYSIIRGKPCYFFVKYVKPKVT